ncbi:MAG: DUF4097 domain-containing protein [Gammaproteobacteria bacterium]|nr:DUF4097 domain-containing protein [Gammaproteobacteria bacterium]
MNKYMTMALATLVSLPVMADDINETINAEDDGHVHVSNIAGSVTVTGWDREMVSVTGTLGRNVDELIIERHGDKVVIKVKVPRHGGRGIDSDLNISVPRDSSLDVGTVSADIEVTEVTGEQGLQAVSGNISTEYFGEDVEVGAVSGDVEVSGNGADGDVSASTVSGSVTVFRASGRIDAESVSGRVTVDEGSFDRAELGSVNGRVTFEGELQDGGKMEVETVNGSVNIDITNRVSGRFDIDTLNGSIRSCNGPKAQRTSKYGPGWELEYEIGDGDSRVEVSTVNGSVSVCSK